MPFSRALLIGCSAFFLNQYAIAGSWNSATHLGYSMEDESSTGFSQVGGSLFILDVGKRFNNSVSLGLRTQGSGGQGKALDFYRLGAGPHLSFLFSNSWGFDLGISFFKESGLDKDGETYYTSKGQNLHLGWQRIVGLSDSIAMSWGGFFAKHWGNIDLQQDESSAGARKAFRPTSNNGSSRGIEIALLISL